MSHDHHFLERLDRVERPHVEFALGLYRDAAMVRRLLTVARVADGAERVALALEDGGAGPHVIVARDGGFVTCLGAGMATGPWPVVSRDRIDAILTREHDLRERQAAARAMVGPGGETTQLLRKIYRASDRLSREDFVAISSFQPLMAPEFLRLCVQGLCDLDTVRPSVMAIGRETNRLERDLLQAYWQLYWSVGHLMVLATMGGPSLLDALPHEVFVGAFTPSAALLNQGMVPQALRGAWCAAKLGKAVLPTYKRQYTHGTSMMAVLDGGLGLATIGLRHARLHAEALKTLAVATPTGPQSESARAIASLRAGIAAVAERGRNDPELLLQTAARYGRGPWMALTAGAAPGTPYRFERAEDIPADFARTVALNTPVNFFDRPDVCEFMLGMLVSVARVAPEELYLPRAAIAAIHTPWTPEHTRTILDPLRRFEPRATPVRAAAVPGRNEPCSCGSERKYKKCCAAARVSVPTLARCG